MGKKMDFNYRIGYYGRNTHCNISVENRRNEVVISVDDEFMHRFSSLGRKSRFAYTLAERYTSEYESDVSTVSLTEKIKQREREIEELKFIRSIIGKKIVINNMEVNT